MVKIGGKMGFINTQYVEVIAPEYDAVGDFKLGIALVEKEGLKGFVDINGGKVTDIKYQEVGEWIEGLALVKSADLYGYLDRKYDEIVPVIYQEIGAFVGGIAWVKLDGKYGLIEQNGRGITPPRYDSMGEFVEGIALVSIEDKWGYINRTGSEVVPLLYTPEEAEAYGKDYIHYQHFSNFAEEYMADKVAAFEAKDEFETAEQHAARVTPESIAALKAELTAEAEKAFIEARASSIVLQLQLGEYDAENQIFPVTDLVYGQYIVNVPLEVAREFKSLWDNTTKTPTLCVENDTITVDKITFRMPDGKEFVTK
jgi:hypothetical protein